MDTSKPQIQLTRKQKELFMLFVAISFVILMTLLFLMWDIKFLALITIMAVVMVFFFMDYRYIIYIVLLTRPLMDIPMMLGFNLGRGINIAGVVAIAMCASFPIVLFMGQIKHNCKTISFLWIGFFVTTIISMLVNSGNLAKYGFLYSISNPLRFLSYYLLFMYVINAAAHKKNLRTLFTVFNIAGMVVVITSLILHFGLQHEVRM